MISTRMKGGVCTSNIAEASRSLRRPTRRDLARLYLEFEEAFVDVFTAKGELLFVSAH
jgi:hypothetical protein